MPIQDRTIARERNKRRLIAQRVKSGYKYLRPEKLSLQPSPRTDAIERERSDRASSALDRPRLFGQ